VDAGGRLGELLDQLKDSKYAQMPLSSADKGESETYRQLRAVVEPFVAQLNAQLVWVMGNHDNRAALRRFLHGEAPSMATLDRVRMIDGLRISTADTSVPGFHHGDISTSQLDWLAEELATPDRGCHWPDSSSKSKR
jgi:3',5'-cyclic AMP phosphodiesterase CpdA